MLKTKKKSMFYFVYILLSLKNSKSYVGFSKNLPQIRLLQHNQGTNRWTSENGPFKLIYYEKYFCEKDARQREVFLKSGVGRQFIKFLVINNNTASAKGGPAFGGG